jgi:dephospho-CoA kinase
MDRIVRTFGKSILDKGKKIDRRKLGKIVFGDPRALYKLNEIVHPPLLKIIKSELNKYRKKSARKLIIIDAALIFEWGIADWCDFILVVTASKSIRIQRMMKDGLTKKEAVDRIKSQLPEQDKIRLADYVIRNNGTHAALKRNTLEFLQALSRMPMNDIQ